MKNEKYVFISYSSKEMSQAEHLRAVLTENDIPCRMAPASIEGGSDYTRSIPDAIAGCTALVLVCSRASQDSYRVKSEMIEAISHSKTIVSFIIEDFPLNKEFNLLLSPMHRVTAYENNAKAYSALIKSLNALLYPEVKSLIVFDQAPEDEPAVKPESKPAVKPGAYPDAPFTAPPAQKPVAQQPVTKQPAEKKAKSSAKKYVLIGIVAAVLTVGVVLALILFVFKGNGNRKPLTESERYTAAQRLMNQGDYENAAEAFDALGDYTDSADMAQECRYLQAKAYMDKKEYDKAIALLQDSQYKDSAKLFKECNYYLGVRHMNENAYVKAISCFENAIGYKDSSDKINECKWKYCNKQKSNTDSRTNQYLKELIAADYSGAQDLYDEIYQWKLTGVWNTSKDDDTTSMTSIPKDMPVYLHYIVEGGPPGGTITLYSVAIYPDGGREGDDKSDSVECKRGESRWIGWEDGLYKNPDNGETGTLTLIIYDDNDQEFATFTVDITE